METNRPTFGVGERQGARGMGATAVGVARFVGLIGQLGKSHSPCMSRTNCCVTINFKSSSECSRNISTTRITARLFRKPASAFSLSNFRGSTHQVEECSILSWRSLIPGALLSGVTLGEGGTAEGCTGLQSPSDSINSPGTIWKVTEFTDGRVF
jgi:hypothetical protein